jgi:hypothetical protein
LLTWMVIFPLFVYQGTMPLGKRETIQAVPITLRHVQSRGITLHAPEDWLRRHSTQYQLYHNITPILPHLLLRQDWRCAAAAPHPDSLLAKGGTQQCARWWAILGCQRLLLMRPAMAYRTSRVADQRKKDLSIPTNWSTGLKFYLDICTGSQMHYFFFDTFCFVRNILMLLLIRVFSSRSLMLLV